MGQQQACSLGCLERGDRVFREAFVAAHYASLFRWLHWLSGDLSTAEDLTQESFLALWAGLAKAESSTDARTWLFAIARNKWRGTLRSRARDRNKIEGCAGCAPPPTLDACDGPRVAMAAECAADVRVAVAALDVDRREAVTLRYWQGLSYADMAVVLDISPELARQRTFQGRRQLHARLAQWAPEDTNTALE